MPENKKTKVHTFVFNQNDNGGESVSLVTNSIYNTEYDERYTVQTLELQCYGSHSTSINLGELITPEKLRKLANELESFLLCLEILKEG